MGEKGIAIKTGDGSQMALFYLVRHGEANYNYMFENGFWGFGRDFIPLYLKNENNRQNWRQKRGYERFSVN